MKADLSTLAPIALLPAAAFAQVTPGKWQITSTVVSADMPGVPPSVMSSVMSMMKKPRTISHCITPEEAKRGPQEMLKRDKSCKFTRWSMAGGRLDAVMVCTQGGGTLTANSKGSFTPTSFDTIGDVVMTGAQSMRMTARSSGKLAGPCTK